MSVKNKTPAQRTRARLLTDQAFVMMLARSLWLEETERHDNVVNRARFDALSRAVHEQWCNRVRRLMNVYINATPSERKAINAKSWARTLKINDAAYAALCKKDGAA